MTKKTFEVCIEMRRLPLSRASIRALHNLDRYDLIVFTSKNARAFFAQALRERRIAPPRRERVIVVGPRAELLTLAVRGKRILFPRSAIAPFDIVHRLRARGASVRAVSLYTTRGAPLLRAHQAALLRGVYAQLYFKSPSGVAGLVRQFSRRERHVIRAIPARCIGTTTARAARAAGFKKVSATGIL